MAAAPGAQAVRSQPLIDGYSTYIHVAGGVAQSCFVYPPHFLPCRARGDLEDIRSYINPYIIHTHANLLTHSKAESLGVGYIRARAGNMRMAGRQVLSIDITGQHGEGKRRLTVGTLVNAAGAWSRARACRVLSALHDPSALILAQPLCFPQSTRRLCPPPPAPVTLPPSRPGPPPPRLPLPLPLPPRAPRRAVPPRHRPLRGVLSERGEVSPCVYFGVHGNVIRLYNSSHVPFFSLWLCSQQRRPLHLRGLANSRGGERSVPPRSMNR